MLILSQRRPNAFEAGADFFPVGIEGGEKCIEFAVVPANVEVGEFVSDNILQGFFVWLMVRNIVLHAYDAGNRGGSMDRSVLCA